MKIALVHDWLDTIGGADRVLIELHRIFPDAPIYTLFAREEFVHEHLPIAQIVTSWLQNVPFRRSPYWVPAMVPAIESFDFSSYDFVISSSPFLAKGIIVRPKTRHICYCYSPTRELWDRNGQSRKGLFGALGKHTLRIWDRVASERVDEFIAISAHVRERIKKYYRRDAWIINPPLTLITSASTEPREKFYLIVSRLYPHKNLDVAVEAFNRLGHQLVIAGTGPQKHHLGRIARGNIRFLGYISDDELASLYRRARALIMPQEEDFGLTPLEAMAHGTPVLALRQGGALEYIREGENGEFFDDAIPEALADGVRRLEDRYASYNRFSVASGLEKFSQEQFERQIYDVINPK